MIKCPQCGTDYDGAERFCPKDGTRLGGTGESYTPRMHSIPPENDPLINKVIQGRYKVLEQIGEGGMGVVYIAEHVEIEKKVALKILRDDFSKRPEVVARFRQEARSASRIGSEHIVDVTDFGQLEKGGVYFVMEYLPGMVLSEVIRKEIISVQRAVSIVLQIAKALNAAHKIGIVHRDMKPENIILIDREDNKDFVKILDFGIAKISDRDSEGQRLTKTGMIFGTPEYMSPEQAAGKPLDHKVDIYALGCIMFEMFTGRVPFEGETFMAVLTQHMFEPVPKLEEMNPSVDVPDKIKQVIYKAMAKDREDRYSDMIELSEDLERRMEDLGYVNYTRETTRTEISLRNTNIQETKKTEIDWQPKVRGIEKRQDTKGIIIGVMAVLVMIGGIGVAYIYGYTGTKKEKITEQTNAVSLKKVVKQRDEEKKPSKTDTTDTEKTNLVDVVKEKKLVKDETATIANKMAVTIYTSPTEAIVSIGGMGQICSKTPCKIDIEEGKQVEVEAKVGDSIEKKTFTPSEQNREITLTIKKQKKSSSKREKKNRAGQKEEKAKNPDGLKIPEFFKNN